MLQPTEMMTVTAANGQVDGNGKVQPKPDDALNLAWNERRRQAAMLPLPHTITTPSEHVATLLRENALYLVAIGRERAGLDASPDLEAWQHARDLRIQMEKEAACLRLPWLRRLDDAGLSGPIASVCNLLLAVSVSPTCLDLLHAAVPFGHSVAEGITLYQVVAASVPRLCDDVAMLRASLGIGGNLTRQGLLCTTRREDSQLAYHVSLLESVVQDAVGLYFTSRLGTNVIARERPEYRLEDIVLPEKQKAEIVALVQSGLATHDDSGIALLFHGPSGTGKTLLARALAHHFQRPLLTFTSEVIDGFALSMDEVFPAIFLRAREEKAIVILDELEEMVLGRAAATRALLIALEKSRCVVLATANGLHRFDPALERRFTARYLIGTPTETCRSRLWEVLLPGGCVYAPDVSLSDLAKLFVFTGGQIFNALQMARRLSGPGVDGLRVLESELIHHCAESQFETFTAQGMVHVHPRGADGIERSSAAYQAATEDARFVAVFRREEDLVRRHFSGRHARGPIILLRSPSYQECLDYARALSTMLGFRLLSSTPAGLVTFLSGEGKSSSLLASPVLAGDCLSRMVGMESILLLQDTHGAFLSEGKESSDGETALLRSAFAETRAIILIAGPPALVVPQATLDSADWIRNFGEMPDGGRPCGLNSLVKRGYPVDASSFVHPRGAFPAPYLQMAALRALLDARTRGEDTVDSGAIAAYIRDLQPETLMVPTLFGSENPKTKINLHRSGPGEVS